MRKDRIEARRGARAADSRMAKAGRRPAGSIRAELHRSEHETRERLITAAARLFAEQGFERVTVREICRAAGANVAAVNYHFGDKLGLYTAVVKSAIAEMRTARDTVIGAAERTRPEDKLRTYIRAYIERVLAADRDAWVHRLMAREMADPTPALDLIVEQAIEPRVQYLAGIVRELLDCDSADVRIPATVASIHGQCLIYVPTPVSARLSGYRRSVTAADVDRIATHIADFSLAGIRAIQKTTGRLTRMGQKT
jgi:TetR/AcrR family transcriptional regulator, regulator of cefoperazone and chloramphenicol sensitivity